MKKYLLLRDNKQTGPYSVEDIRVLGVKPYDLIWVEGRSAAWRYPGEIDEFKSFAPQVEEQPYDRFFKRPSGEAKIVRTATDLPVAEEKPRIVAEIKSQIIAAASSEADQKSMVSPLQKSDEPPQSVNASNASQKLKENEGRRPKYVSVSMPSGSIKSVPAPMDTREEKQVQQIPDETRRSAPPVPEIKLKDGHAAEQKLPAYIAPAVEHIPVSGRMPGSIMQVFAVAVAVISLVAVGMLIGIGIGSNRAKNSTPDTQKSVATTEPTDNSTPVDVISQPVVNLPKDTVSKSLVSGQKEKTKKTVTKPATVLQTTTVETPPPADPLPQTAAETAKVPDPKDIAKQNIASLVSASTNNYKVGMFGGIDDVKVTVSNTSEYPIDLVVVDVSYIQNNKKSFKTESLHFNDIAANSSLTLDAPKASKGIKVKTTITHIASKSLGVSENLW